MKKLLEDPSYLEKWIFRKIKKVLQRKEQKFRLRLLQKGDLFKKIMRKEEFKLKVQQNLQLNRQKLEK
jgi:hypothetical protein